MTTATQTTAAEALSRVQGELLNLRWAEMQSRRQLTMVAGDAMEIRELTGRIDALADAITLIQEQLNNLS